jgi:hypothetical protein
MAALFSAIMMVGALVLAVVTVGMMGVYDPKTDEAPHIEPGVGYRH